MRERGVHQRAGERDAARETADRLRALGTAKGITDWARDRRCSVTVITIGRRLRAGWAPDDAITAPATRVGSRGHTWSPVTAFGVTKGVVEWARDRRCKVGASGLATRLAKGMDPEAAITTPPFGEPARRTGPVR